MRDGVIKKLSEALSNSDMEASRELRLWMTTVAGSTTEDNESAASKIRIEESILGHRHQVMAGGVRLLDIAYEVESNEALIGKICEERGWAPDDVSAGLRLLVLLASAVER